MKVPLPAARAAILAAALAAGAAGPAFAADAPGRTLDTIKQRGVLLCGVNEGLAGFSASDGKDHWAGFDIDYCKALAAAVLGEARMGAGVAVAPDRVLTAHYLVLGASKAEVTAVDGRPRGVDRVSIDHESGLALLFLHGEPLRPAVLSPDAVEPGLPESFNVLVRELQSLCLDVELLSDRPDARGPSMI